MKPRHSFRACIIAAGLCTLVCGCSEDEIRAYRAPRQHNHAEHAGQPMQPESRVVWTVPQGWESVASDQPMRLATFKPGQGLPEVSLAAFPGDTGGLLANINRWRGQIGLGPIDEPQLAQSTSTETVEGVIVTLTEMTGSSGQQLLGAIITPGDGKTWFLKATGEPAAIAQIKPPFTTFSKSFRLKSEGAAPLVAPVTATGDVQSRLTAWKPPQNWRADPNASTIVAAAYDATNSDGGAKITATMLMNDGGGALSNINRWRDQLGLPPFDKLEQQPTSTLGGNSVLVDLTAADNARRMVSTIVSAEGHTWFFKMTGSPKAIDAERANYDGFVKSVGLGESTK